MTELKTLLDVSIFPVWKKITEIRNKTRDTLMLKGWDNSVIEAISMCITELTENAIKYGSNSKEQKTITIKMEVENGFVILKVSNYVTNDKHLNTFFQIIEKIKQVDNPEQLYINRLLELRDNPQKGISKLGLYRIAFEGGLSIGYTLENNILTVIARRTILPQNESISEV